MEHFNSEIIQAESLAELNLKTLQEFGSHLNSAVNSKFIFDNLLFTCMAKFLTTRSAIYLFKDDKLELFTVKGIDENTIEKQIILSKEFCKEKIYQDNKLNEFSKKHAFELFECISTSRDILGVILLGRKADSSPYSEDDKKFLRTILNISAPAIENLSIVSQLQSLNKALNTKISQVNSLFELSKEFSLLLDEQNICKLLSYTIMGYMMVTKYVIALQIDNNKRIIDKNVNSHKLDSVIEKIDWNKIDGATKVHPLEDRYSNDLLEMGIELIVPMQIRTKTKGLILLGAKSTRQEYSENDKEFLESLGSIAIVALENTRLFKESLEKKKLEEDIAIAKEIQQNLFPRKIPTSIAFKISAVNYPSKQVGGDYYDIFRINPKEILFLIADVSGKGIGASLIMANLQAFIKSLARSKIMLDEATCLLNDLVVENLTQGKFITFFWGILNEELKTLEYVNAGHNPPILLRDGRIEKLNIGGMILGVFKSMNNYKAEKMILNPNDLIFLFTDGVTEAKNKNEEDFSDERLNKLILENYELEPENLIKKVKAEIEQFSIGTEQSDDITMMAIKVLP